MTSSDIIRTLMKQEKVTYQRMATMIGKEKATDVGARLWDTPNLGTRCFVEMLNVLGYELVVQKRTCGVRPREQIVVEIGEKKKK